MKRSLRLDLVHSGDGGTEAYRLVAIRELGDWLRPIVASPAVLGDYRWLLESLETGKCLASQGFSPLFAEWQTTAEASEGGERTFQEFFQVPEPERKSCFRIQRRNTEGQFYDVFQTTLDPDFASDKPISPSAPLKDVELLEIAIAGPAIDRIDILILADGYTVDEKPQFEADAHRLRDILFSVSPYRERIEDFNVRALFVPSPQSGISDPGRGIERQTAFSSSFNSLGIDRYLLPQDMKAVYDACDRIQWDALILLCNTDKFGGGGLYNQYACAASRCIDFEYLIVHEFAHCFAGLADEYYTKPVTYDADQTAELHLWEANVDTLDPRGNVKWQPLIDADVPVPTPWDKQTYETLMQKYEAWRNDTNATPDQIQTAMDHIASNTRLHLTQQSYYGQVGAFEGARYQANGLYRPELDCIMFSRKAEQFCQVCQAAIRQTIDRKATNPH